jgi:Flp pilus assembly protein TadG
MIGICVSNRGRYGLPEMASSNRRGAMLVFVAVSMVVLTGFLAMTLDVGAASRQRRIAQTAADAAALAGAAEIWRGITDAGVIKPAAQAEAIRNGFNDADSDVQVQVFYEPGPSTGPYAGNAAYVEVVVDKTIPTIFGSIFNITSLAVHTRAVAGVGSYALNCIYSLDPSGPAAIEVKNGGELTTNCGVSINSTNPNALDVNNSGQLDTQGGGIAIAGGWTGNKTPTPTPSSGAPLFENPLKDLVMPTVGACNFTNVVVTGTQTLTPGVYCGGITVATGSNRANLATGLYIILGGGITVGNSGQFYGDGVTLINTFDVTHAYGPFNFGTGCKAKLTAPTAGDWKGILMFQDPAAPANVINTFACASDEDPELTGTIYFPTQTFFFDGSNTSTEITGSVIAKNVVVSGKVEVINEKSANSAIQRFTLVE